MSANTESEWHFVVMIGASFIVFIYVIRFCLTKQQFTQKFSRIILLAFVIAVGGMFLGKFGANLGLPWWIYYPIPMMMTVFIPPVTLAMTARQTGAYLVLSLFSAPFIT